MTTIPVRAHQAVRLIDAAPRQLHHTRVALIGELRADHDERAIRADGMIAEFRAFRVGGQP